MSLESGSWRIEFFEDNTAFGAKCSEKLHDHISKFQRVEVYDTVFMGRILLLGDCFMVTERDSFIYHEMLTHPAVSVVGAPKSALVIGGGDGGAITELCKYDSIESLTLCEIDPEVIEVSRKYFPNISAGLDDPRVTIRTEDAVVYIDGADEKWDIILVDSTDPIGPGKGLFERPFFENVRDRLTDSGVAVFQTESPIFMAEVFKKAVADLSKVFGDGKAAPYLAVVPSYPGGLWSFTICSLNRSPGFMDISSALGEVSPDLQYYNTEIHRAAFSLPEFVKKMVNGPELGNGPLTRE